jgi:outer membrane protein TolC
VCPISLLFHFNSEHLPNTSREIHSDSYSAFRRRSSTATRARSNTRVSALEAEIRAEVRYDWRQYETARALLAYIETDMLKQTGPVLDTKESSYRRGEASFVDFLDARQPCNKTTQSYNEAHAECARSLYLIDGIIGR